VRTDDLVLTLLGRSLALLPPAEAERMAEEVGEQYGRAMAAGMAADGGQAGQRSFRTALHAVADALTAHGFAAHTEKRGNQLRIVNNHCPFGAVAMALIGGRIPPWRRPGRVLLIVVALFGLSTVGFGLSTSFPLSLALLVVCGALDNISVVIRLTLEQMVVPDAIRGRVSAVHYVFIGMSNELGAAESGLAAFALGTVPAIVAGGALAVLVVGVVALRWRELAKMPPLAELQPPEDPGPVAHSRPA
jgi:MFS family permease